MVVPAWSGRLLLAVGLLCGCGGAEEPARPGDAPAHDLDASRPRPDTRDDAPSPPPPCASGTAHRYDPLGADELLAWPDDVWTVPAPDRPTGIRLAVDAASAPWVARLPDLLADVPAQLAELSGFALNGDVLLRFTGPVAPPPAAVAAALASDALLWLDLGAEGAPPARVPYTARLADGGRDVLLTPLVPLRPGARHAVWLTTAYRDAAGDCIEPSPLQQRLLAGEAPAPGFARVAAAAPAALEASGLEPWQVVAFALFTTHDDAAVHADHAAGVRAAPPAWTAPAGCVLEGGVRRCELAYEAADFRAGGARRALTAHAWLPAGTDGPPPVVLYGHGMNNDRFEAEERVVPLLAPLGFAVVADDALEHGLHRARPGGPRPVLSFLGLDLDTGRFDARAARGHFTQSALDRVQLLAALRAHPDLDGDGAPDVDPARLAHWGISLGAAIGAAVMALDDDLGAGVLSVGGGRLVTYLTESEDLAPFLPLLALVIGSDAEAERLLVVLQTLLDAADPATFGAHVLRERLSGAAVVPSLLVPVAEHDDVVPPSAGRALARALRIPHLAPVATPVPLLEVVPAPVRGNLAAGTATAAFFQLDRVGGANASPPSPATHGNAPLSPEGAHQALHFLSTWATDGLGEIVDPYAALGTPPRAP